MEYNSHYINHREFKHFKRSTKAHFIPVVDSIHLYQLSYGTFYIALIGYSKVSEFWIAAGNSIDSSDAVSMVGTVLMYNILWTSFVFFVKDMGTQYLYK